MTLPPAALRARDRLDEALHRSDRHIGVITGGHEHGLRLIILTGADDADSARAHAERLTTAALHQLDLGELTARIEVGEVVGRLSLAGGPRLADAAPPLDYRRTTLPDARVLRAACRGPLDEWFAYVEDEPGRVIAGRVLAEVLRELFELPWGRPGDWFYQAIEELAGHATADGVRYPCPCCDKLTLVEVPAGTFAICEVCRWEDDRVQFRDPDYPGGANKVSLRQARENYRREGVSEPRDGTS